MNPLILNFQLKCMINLQDTSGLPLLLNTQDNSLQPAGEITFDKRDRIKLENLKPVLLNKTLRYPIDIYSEYGDICIPDDQKCFKKSKLHYSIILLPPGLLGIEYNKTHIFSPDQDQNDISVIVDIIYGKGSILIQRVKEKGEYDFDTEVDFVAHSKIRKGNRVVVPQNYMYTFINPSNYPLIIARLYEDDGKIDYRSMRKEHGMSYYLIRKNARQEIVRNPHYKEVPPLKKFHKKKYLRKYSCSSKKPIYTQFMKKPKKFCKLLV